MDRKNTNTGVLILFLLAIAFFVIGNRLCAVVMESSNPIALLGSSDPLELIGKALSNPMPSGDGAAIAVGILFAVVPMWVVASFRGNEEIRHGDEHGSARLGTVEHARRFTDIKNRDNNIVLTRDIGIAIYPNKYVRDPLPHRNVCVFGSTGSGKTTSYVMPNILQVEADRDLVVVDPKGTTLSMCGHALVEAGIDVRCLNLVDLPKSDHYNPLTNIRDYDDITSVVRLLIRSTNEGKDNSDRIWDAGEALLLRALITLLWDWFPRSELTMQSVVDLEMMAEVKGHFDVNCPLSLIFNQIATGEKTVTTGGRGGESPVAGASGAKVVRVPSLLRRNDGVCPAKVTKADGTHGLDTTNDESLRLWTEFCHAAEKTIQSFVISNHTRLAYLSTPGVLGMLCHNGQPDELNLNLLGQRTDECGDQTRPRVIFAIASDIDSVLSPLLSLFCWQAVKLPVRAAQHYRDGSLPRAVSFIFDEFPNIGRIEDFERMVAAVRSRNIDLSVICQNTSQLDAVYGEATAKTIRDNTSILYLGGGTSYYTAADLSKVIGNTTIYKEDVSRQGTGLGCTASIQRSSMARPLFEPDELMRLPKDEAVVIAGPDGPYQDKKQQVWKCRRYDKTYMARHPKRSFDYMSWKKAGKPYGEKFHAWEEVHFNEVLPARDDLEKKRQAHKWAKNRGDRKRESETMKKLVESCDRLVRAERHAREVATVSDPDSQS